MPGGRPSLYRPEYADAARLACARGATNETLALQLGVARSTIDAWIDSRPEFAEAVEAGRALADQEVVAALFSRAVGRRETATRLFWHDGQAVPVEYPVERPPDVRACIFWLRNRRPEDWREDRMRGRNEHQFGPEDEWWIRRDRAEDEAAASAAGGTDAARG